MAAVTVGDVVVKLNFDVNAQPTMREELVALAKRECPDGATLEIEQTLDSVGTIRVKLTKP